MLLCLVFSSFAQTSNGNNTDDIKRREAEARATQIQRQNLERDKLAREKRETERNAEKIRVAKSIERKQVKKPPIIETATAEDKQLLEPTESEKLLYKDFLKNKNSGLIILFRYPNCELYPNNKIIDTTCENNGFSINGGGSHYSFRNKTYVRGNWLDLQFINNELIARGNLIDREKNTQPNLNGYVQGIIVSLGNVKIEDINRNNKAFNWLSDFTPATNFNDAKNISEKLSKGVTIENYTFSESVKFEVGNTYLLRSIPYPTNQEYLTSEDKEIDILVAFQVLKIENNKLLIVWKKLKQKKAPKLKL